VSRAEGPVLISVASGRLNSIPEVLLVFSGQNSATIAPAISSMRDGLL
jgi:hypothetical protein